MFDYQMQDESEEIVRELPGGVTPDQIEEELEDETEDDETDFEDSDEDEDEEEKD